MADNSTGNSLFQTWINRALWTVLTGSVSGLLAIHVWVFLAILERPTNIQAEKLVQSYALNEDEVRKMLQREAPYLKDRERILRSLNGKYYLKVNGTEYALTVDTGSNDGAINFDDGDVTTLGALRTTSVQKYFEGKIAHWTAYNNVPTVADRTLVRNFLGITYGVTIAS